MGGSVKAVGGGAEAVTDNVTGGTFPSPPNTRSTGRRIQKIFPLRVSSHHYQKTDVTGKKLVILWWKYNVDVCHHVDKKKR